MYIGHRLSPVLRDPSSTVAISRRQPYNSTHNSLASTSKMRYSELSPSPYVEVQTIFQSMLRDSNPLIIERQGSLDRQLNKTWRNRI